jgi:hypothetical protein
VRQAPGLDFANTSANRVVAGVRYLPSGHQRFKGGSWRLIVDAGKDPVTGRRRQIFRTVRAPNTRAGAQLARPK